MRPKVVITVIVLGVLTLVSLFAIRRNSDRFARISEARPAPSAAPQKDEQLVSKPQAVLPPTNATPANRQPETSSEDEHKAYVEQRGAQLMELAMNDDRASLDTILSELGNRDPQIRKAALDATIQFGSRDAIPKLADAASQTDDPNEKAALADAIEFLKLPSLTEVRQQSAKSVANNGALPAPRSGRKGGFGKRDLPAPAPSPN